MGEILTAKQQRAKKKHICHLCEKPILPGNMYIYETYKDDGRFQTIRRHIHCDAMLDAYNDLYNCESYYVETEVTETLWSELCRQICSEEQQDECKMEDLYGCELCQRKILNPSILGAVFQSVKDNYDWDAEEG